MTSKNELQIRPLEELEERALERLVIENSKNLSENELKDDFDHIKILTSEIRSIGKQGVLLMGERIYDAREILKPYRDGTFTKWLQFTLGSVKSGYNMLAYFELYTELPENSRENFKKLPQKAAYVLASRNIELQRKEEIINTMYHLKSDELINEIRDMFPKAKRIRSKKWSVLFKVFDRLHHKKLVEKDREALLAIREKIDELLGN
ncbi:MAG: CT583 family protein [Parachlamydia sp.]|nr:CT583 family protein [Parachlamydia sp.]